MNINYDTVFGSNIKSKAIPQINIDNATMGIVRGLECYIGEDYKWIPAYDHVSEWLMDNQHKGLLMVGGNGTGKTTLEQILKKIITHYIEVEYGGRIRSSFVSAYEIKYAWDNYCPLQVIDDIGKEASSKTFGEAHDYFAQIIDRAELKGQLLICSTNLNKEELKEKYDGRTLDRMRSAFKIVFFKGESMRG